MALKKLVQRLTTQDSELDLARLRSFCSSHPDFTPIADLKPRVEASAIGEISSLRIVSLAGSPSLEAVLTDGVGSLVLVWTGRRRIAGVTPGRRMMVWGRGSPTSPSGRLRILNPRYELL